MPEEIFRHQDTKTPRFTKRLILYSSWCNFVPLRLGGNKKILYQSQGILNFRNALILFFLSLTSISFSQNSTPCDLKFVFHLVNAGDNEEAIYLLDSTNCYSGYSNDSLNYLRGWSLYSLKRLVPSSESLIKVRPGSEFYLKSHFFAAYNYTYTLNFSKALETLSRIEFNSEKLNSLKNLELSGIYLLQGQKDKFEDYFSRTNRTYYEISESAENLQKISADLYKHKTKSPVVAGLLSTIIPGSGKFYAGKRGEAISAFIANAGLGLVTWENYRKSGLNSFRTIAFGSAFVFSYAANIYGAILNVNMQETEYKENVKNSILFNLHIPLRNSFDK
jgi:TM2 domain-containing membrane protein YozV